MAQEHLSLFVVGAPGVGKTTLVRELLGMPKSVLELTPKPKWTVTGRIAAAGHYTGATFDGADMVPYNGAKEALEYWAREIRPHVDLTIFDGDRFSNANALERIEREGQVAALHVTASSGTLTERREARGSNQNPAWMKGRETKAERFAQSIEQRFSLLYMNGMTPIKFAALVRQKLALQAQPRFL